VRSGGNDEETAGTSTWTDPGWRAAAIGWAVDELGRAGLRLDGEPEQPHVYPWSTAIRLPVHGGAVWLKAVAPGSSHEPPLSAALGRWVPESVLLRLRDAYLEGWHAYGSPQDLREQCDLALWVGPLQRALSWRRILRGVHPGERAQWQDSVPGWTGEHLERGTLTAAPAGA
jgi:hypothetical protein